MVPAIGIVQPALGAPDDVGGDRLLGVAADVLVGGLVERERLALLEQPERALDLPDQVGRCRGRLSRRAYRHCRRNHTKTVHRPLPRWINSVLTLRRDCDSSPALWLITKGNP